MSLASKAALVLLFGAHLWLGAGLIRSAAPTYDEPVHLASGYSYLATGRYRLNVMDHPPLAEMWAAAPLLRLGPSVFAQHPDFAAGRLYHYSDFFLYRNRVGADRMLRHARWFCFLTWSGLLYLAVLAWAGRLAGEPGMLGAAAVYAFSPALVSNLPLATTDGGSAVLFFWTLWLLSGALDGGPARWALAGVCAGLAHAAKFNMILLGPLSLGMLLLEARLRGKRGPAPLAGGLLALSCALVALAAVYRFGQLPSYWAGLSATLGRLEEGRSAFFLGRHSTTGFLLYFPVALLLKTPLPAWIAAGLGLWSVCREREGPGRWWAVLPPLAYLGAAMTSKVQIGYRHVLPVVPFLALWAGVGAAWFWRRRAGRFLLPVLAAWLALSVARVHPHHLAYFNELAGGPSNGYRYLVDSNLDWGQGLKELAEKVRALGNPPVYLSYFGTADPSAYGLRYVPVAFLGNVVREGDAADPSASGRVLLAVSATNLQCTYFADKGLFDWLKTRRPLLAAGYSIFLYDLTGDAQACRGLARLLELSGKPGEARKLLLKLPRQ